MPQKEAFLVHSVVACNDPAIQLPNQEMQRDNSIRPVFFIACKNKNPGKKHRGIVVLLCS
jgi:hypothetical protein